MIPDDCKKSNNHSVISYDSNLKSGSNMGLPSRGYDLFSMCVLYI